MTDNEEYLEQIIDDLKLQIEKLEEDNDSLSDEVVSLREEITEQSREEDVYITDLDDKNEQIKKLAKDKESLEEDYSNLEELSSNYLLETFNKICSNIKDDLETKKETLRNVVKGRLLEEFFRQAVDKKSNDEFRDRLKKVIKFSLESFNDYISTALSDLENALSNAETFDGEFDSLTSDYKDAIEDSICDLYKEFDEFYSSGIYDFYETIYTELRTLSLIDNDDLDKLDNLIDGFSFKFYNNSYATFPFQFTETYVNIHDSINFLLFYIQIHWQLETRFFNDDFDNWYTSMTHTLKNIYKEFNYNRKKDSLYINRYLLDYKFNTTARKSLHYDICNFIFIIFGFVSLGKQIDNVMKPKYISIWIENPNDFLNNNELFDQTYCTTELSSFLKMSPIDTHLNLDNTELFDCLCKIASKYYEEVKDNILNINDDIKFYNEFVNSISFKPNASFENIRLMYTRNYILGTYGGGKSLPSVSEVKNNVRFMNKAVLYSSIVSKGVLIELVNHFKRNNILSPSTEENRVLNQYKLEYSKNIKVIGWGS